MKMAAQYQYYKAVNTFWMEDLKEKASAMKTSRCVYIDGSRTGQVAYICWHNPNPLEAHMAPVIAIILVHRYALGYSHYAGLRKVNTSLYLVWGE